MKHFLIFLSSLLLIFSYSFTALHTLASDPPKEMKVTLKKSEKIAPCDDHGGPASTGMQWTVATRKSECERGIGFRCGTRLRVTCGNGYVWYGEWSGLHRASRSMESTFVFYTNNTLKITLDQPLPPGETSRYMEVDEVTYVTLPEAVYLNGMRYSGFNVLPGQYSVSPKGGPFGSVTVAIQLLN